MVPNIRLLLADDHALVREALKHLFALSPDIIVVAEAANSKQVLDALPNEQPDVILLDMSMPGLSGPELITHIVASRPPPPILVLSVHNEPLIIRHALAAGAAGYLNKDTAPDILFAAIRKVAAGGRFLDPRVAEALAFELGDVDKLQQRHESLSRRELEILTLLGNGVRVSEIAARLAISNKTVSTHKSRLMEKMRFSSNADLVRYAVNCGITD